jgi:hypothetical protein
MKRRAPLTHEELERLRDRCSFHLLAPMVEAYFFGDPSAIARALSTASAPSTTTWCTCGLSVEQFATSDPPYVDYAASPTLSKAERAGDKSLAWRAAERELHPKHYLQFLCRAGPLGYREGKAGVAALSKLAFPQVVAAGAPLPSEMLADIEDGLGLTPMLGAGAPAQHPGVLRNL